MKCCSYCGQKATTRIVPDPQEVCLTHAIEYWRGLLSYGSDWARDCVRFDRLCRCARCEELRMAGLRAAAIALAGQSPADHADFQIRRAS